MTKSWNCPSQIIIENISENCKGETVWHFVLKPGTFGNTPHPNALTLLISNS